MPCGCGITIALWPRPAQALMADDEAPIFRCGSFLPSRAGEGCDRGAVDTVLLTGEGPDERIREYRRHVARYCASSGSRVRSHRALSLARGWQKMCNYRAKMRKPREGDSRGSPLTGRLRRFVTV